MMNESNGIGATANDDLLDDGLVNMPGMRIEGKVGSIRDENGNVHKNDEQPKHEHTEKRTKGNYSTQCVAGNATPAHDILYNGKFADDGWDTASKSNATTFVKQCAKNVLLFGGMEALFFYWQQTEQMTASAAYPAIVICATLAGLSVGVNVGKYLLK